MRNIRESTIVIDNPEGYLLLLNYGRVCFDVDVVTSVYQYEVHNVASHSLCMDLLLLGYCCNAEQEGVPNSVKEKP